MSTAADGRPLLLDTFAAGNFDIVTLQLTGDPAVTPLLANPSFREALAAVSPDGRWIAYESNETRRGEVYVRPFPDVEAGKWQVSSSEGRRPRCAPDGRKLFFQSAGALYAAAIETGSTFAAGTAERILSFDDLPGVIVGDYDISGDGTRFLFMKHAEASVESVPPQLNVVTHWFEELKRLAPTGGSQ